MGTFEATILEVTSRLASSSPPGVFNLRSTAASFSRLAWSIACPIISEVIGEIIPSTLTARILEAAGNLAAANKPINKGKKRTQHPVFRILPERLP
jgi:hypothetical protein